MQAIANWLQNGTYDDGVRLYEQHGSNAFLKQKFKLGGANAYNVTKLREELVRLAESVTPKAESQPLPTTEPVKKPSAQPKPEQAKKYLQLTNKKQKLYQLLGMLMEQKHYLPEGEELRQCAAKILTTHQQITETWAAIDYYQEHQCFPDDEVKPKETLEPKKEMQLLRQTISKAKARLASPSCRNREQTQQLLTNSQTRLAELVANKRKK
ncbi:hypothetical protein SAMN05192574_101382 [Mucilaginibacter gossypiicola]|uniref:Uncharacterized protein n=1 Tax=Mucilaginibacter gossypiicola TaxID=551995 RepID=A0A1H8A6M5_9SPHI|nr:hypothetical protein [Mucilaginibacter gossypiicola]SEM66251.1 hypothetical protein SAMN05192574_101382 [Mucilaginibacter gossypiicola]